MTDDKCIRTLVLLLLALFLVECKNQEKTSSQPSKYEMNDCTKLTRNAPEHSLVFVAERKANSEKIAVQKAKKETIIKLVQFFQSEFIDGNQFDHLKNGDMHNSQFRKEWAETSYEMIGTLHNHNSFTHKQKVSQSGSGNFRVLNMLIISQDWIRNHWQKSFAATDSAFYNMVSQEKHNGKIKEMDIRQDNPCKQLH